MSYRISLSGISVDAMIGTARSAKDMAAGAKAEIDKLGPAGAVITTGAEVLSKCGVPPKGPCVRAIASEAGGYAGQAVCMAIPGAQPVASLVCKPLGKEVGKTLYDTASQSYDLIDAELNAGKRRRREWRKQKRAWQESLDKLIAEDDLQWAQVVDAVRKIERAAAKATGIDVAPVDARTFTVPGDRKAGELLIALSRISMRSGALPSVRTFINSNLDVARRSSQDAANVMAQAFDLLDRRYDLIQQSVGVIGSEVTAAVAGIAMQRALAKKEGFYLQVPSGMVLIDSRGSAPAKEMLGYLMTQLQALRIKEKAKPKPVAKPKPKPVVKPKPVAKKKPVVKKKPAGMTDRRLLGLMLLPFNQPMAAWLLKGK